MSYRTKEQYNAISIESNAFDKYIDYMKQKYDQEEDEITKETLRGIIKKKLNERIEEMKKY